jgi:hypothetical protein
MTVVAEAPPRRGSAGGSGRLRKDWLVAFSEAARTLGTTPETLRSWHAKGDVPAIVGPGGGWLTYASWIADVMRSARPGSAGDIAAVTRDWFATHIPEALSA